MNTILTDAPLEIGTRIIIMSDTCYHGYAATIQHVKHYKYGCTYQIAVKEHNTCGIVRLLWMKQEEFEEVGACSQV